MASTTVFCNDFWEDDGFERLIHRLRQSKENLKDWHEYLTARASAEDSYARSIGKLAKMKIGVSEVGTSARATTGILDHCLAIAEERKRFAERLRGIANAVMQYKNTQKQIRKNNLSEKEKVTKALTKVQGECDSAQQKYYKAKETLNTLEEQYLEMDATATKKETDRIQSQIKRTHKDVDKFRKKYSEAVESVNRSQAVWVETMDRLFVDLSCVQGQTCDFLREQLQVYCDVESSFAEEWSNDIAQMTTVVGLMDTAQDLALWVEENATGSRRPEPVVFVDFGETVDDAVRTKRMSMVYSGHDVGLALASGSEFGSIAEEDDTTVNTTDASSPSPSRGGLEDVADPQWDSFADGAGGDDEESSDTVTALWGYEARYVGELSMREGDQILVLEKPLEGWWVGSISGVEGYFPQTYTTGACPFEYFNSWS